MRFRAALLVASILSFVGISVGSGPAALDELLFRDVRRLFRAYEQRDLGTFQRATRRLTTDSTFTWGPSIQRLSFAVNSDLANLRSVQFSEYVYQPIYNPARTTARVSVTWFRRSNFASSAEEWIVRAQTTILQFDVSSDLRALMLIEGAPLFGLCDAAGTLVVDRGEINGIQVAAPRIVRNGRLQPIAQPK